MTNRNAPGDHRVQQSGDHEPGRPGDGEVQVPPSPNGDRAAASPDDADRELLCTICGLRACWQ